MRVSVCVRAILIPEYLDFHSGYSAPRSRIAGIYSGIYSYSGISQTNAPLVYLSSSCVKTRLHVSTEEVRVLYNVHLFFHSGLTYSLTRNATTKVETDNHFFCNTSAVNNTYFVHKIPNYFWILSFVLGLLIQEFESSDWLHFNTTVKLISYRWWNHSHK